MRVMCSRANCVVYDSVGCVCRNACVVVRYLFVCFLLLIVCCFIFLVLCLFLFSLFGLVCVVCFVCFSLRLCGVFTDCLC